jgi:hypothetical protein
MAFPTFSMIEERPPFTALTAVDILWEDNIAKLDC